MEIKHLTTGGNEISVCPERGGIITSLKFQGVEVLYLDEDTLQNREANVRGGIPILFPNVGPIASDRFPGLKQHGFARNSSEWPFEKLQDGFSETLVSSFETRSVYPYEFSLSVKGISEEDGSCTITQLVENLEEVKSLPIAMGLHPYFKVPNEEKQHIQFNFAGGAYIKENFAKWENGEFISIDNPNKRMEIVIPQLGTLFIQATPEYRKIRIWSLPEKDFICIEPAMRDDNGIVDDPELIPAKTSFAASMNIQFVV